VQSKAGYAHSGDQALAAAVHAAAAVIRLAGAATSHRTTDIAIGTDNITSTASTPSPF